MNKEKRFYSKEQLNMMRKDVTSSLSYIDLMSQFTEIKPVGKWAHVKCPFHQTDTFDAGRLKENNNDYAGVYYCNHPGCLAYSDNSDGMNMIEFWQEMNGLEHIYDAVIDLYSNVLNRPLPEPDDKVTDDIKERLKENEKRKLLLRYAALFYNSALFSKIGKDALIYLTKRGITAEMAKMYKIGYAPGNLQDIDYFKKKGFSEKELKKEGFLSKNGKSSLWGRIVFPLFSTNNNPLSDKFDFKKAVIENLYSRQMPKFEKNENAKAFRHRYLNNNFPMYNYGEAKRKKWCIIPEGCFDALATQTMINKLSHKNVNKDTLGVFASYGTNGFKADINLPLLKRARYETIFLAGDSDDNLAGETANLKKAELFNKELDTKVRILLLKDEDMNEFYLKHQNEPEKLISLMKNAVTLEEYKILVKIKSLGTSNLSNEFELINGLNDILKEFNIENENILKYYKTLQVVAKYLDINIETVLLQLLYLNLKDEFAEKAMEKKCSLESLLFQKVLEIQSLKKKDL